MLAGDCEAFFGKLSPWSGDVVDGTALDLKDIIYPFPNK
jgi:hypothetical protein